MKILEHAIDRPLPTFLAALLVVGLGIWSMLELPVRRNPEVEIPVVIVATTYAGAGPDEVESEITLELEEELNSIDELRHLNSVSREGVATQFLEFEDRTDLGTVLRSVRDRVHLAEVDFPSEASQSVVTDISFDELPIVIFTLSGADGDLDRLRVAAEELTPLLESVSGVSRVERFGGFEPEVRVVADPATLARYDLTLDDVGVAIAEQGRALPAGQVRSTTQDLLVRSTGEFADLAEIRSVMVATDPAGPILLGDIARVELAHHRLTTGSWFDGDPSVSLIVRRRPSVDTLETVKLLKAQVAEFATRLPPNIRVGASSNSADLIEAMVRQLGMSALLGFALVTAVLFLMFGARQALLISAVLPISVLATFIGLYLFDMEISNISMFAIILVLGLVVDGAIVVGEAIYAEREAGNRSVDAAKRGLARVGMPVIAADLTTIAAFVPMLMMVGVMGQFMSVLPKIVVFALVGSVFVDHLLLPAAAAKLGVRRNKRKRRLAPDGIPWFSPELPRARRFYLRSLEAALRRRWQVVAVAASAFVLAIAALASGSIDSIFLPTVDQGRFTVDYALPMGASLNETNRIGQLISEEIAELDEVKGYVLTTGDTGALNSDFREGGRNGSRFGRISVELVSRSERLRPQAAIVAALRPKISHYAGVEIDLDELGEGPSVGSALAIRVQGEQLDSIHTASQQVRSRIAALPGAIDVRVDYERGLPEVKVDVDRLGAAAVFGISSEQVARTLRAAFHGLEVGRMWIAGERVDIRLQADESFAHNPQGVRELMLRSASGEIVPLGALASVDLQFTHDAIYRYNTVRTATVRADPAPGTSSVALEQAARTALMELALPDRVRISFGGETEERDRSYASLWSALKWGIALIFIVMAIQFNSIAQPVIVLLAVPLSVVGVVLGLLVTGTPFSFMVFIGVVSLTGIVVNDGIVLIDAINQNRNDGMPCQNAIFEAANRRLRPVLLTTITTIFGLLPLTIGVVEGSEFWVPLGVAIISGLLVASILTLVVVPVLYAILDAMMPVWGHEQDRALPLGASPGQSTTRA